jgi:solute carrier family 41
MILNSSESNYLKPQYLRQRSSSCGSNWCQVCKEENQPEIHLDIHLVRRRSLGHNMKLSIDTPVVVNNDKENKNELIISIPVLTRDNNSIKKDFDLESCDEHITYGEPNLQSSWSALRQMLIPFLIAGIGSVGAGIVLNKVQHWPAFDAIPQLIIMIPSFLGLIGNIETTLASRLSTHANLGTLDTYSELKSIIIGNSAVVQCQASTVGLFAAIASLVMSYITSSHKNSPTFNDMLLLSASSVISSVLANTLLATTITIVIVVARKININPGMNFRIGMTYSIKFLMFNI